MEKQIKDKIRKKNKTKKEIEEIIVWIKSQSLRDSFREVIEKWIPK